MMDFKLRQLATAFAITCACASLSTGQRPIEKSTMRVVELNGVDMGHLLAQFAVRCGPVMRPRHRQKITNGICADHLIDTYIAENIDDVDEKRASVIDFQSDRKGNTNRKTFVDNDRASE